MSQEPPVLSPKVCPKCGAANYAHVEICWLCHAKFNQNPADINPYAVQISPPRPAAQVQTSELLSSGLQSRTETMFLWLMVAIVILAVLVGIGLGVQDRGLLSLFLVVTVPSLAAASVRALYSVAKGEAPKPSKIFTTFIVSATLTILTGALLLICSVIFLFLMCAQMLSVGPR